MDRRLKHMRCMRCGHDLPASAAFCMHCGQPAQPAAPAGALALPRDRSRMTWYAVGLAAAVLLAVLGGLVASGLVRLGGAQDASKALVAEGATPSPDLLRIDEGRPPGLLQREGQGGAPDLGRGAQRRIMPDDIRRWLEHLERIERKREALSTQQLSKAMTMMTALQLGDSLKALQGLLNSAEEEPISPTESTRLDIEPMRTGWQQLEQEFASVPPPAECGPIARDYTIVLTETRGMILDIVSQIDRASEDREGALAALMGMQGKSGTRIGKPARDTDDGVYQICRKYDTRKWFSIHSDFNSGMMGRMGF